MTSADLRQRAEQCRAKIPLQLSHAAKRLYEAAADTYITAASADPGPSRVSLARRAKDLEDRAEEAAALVAKHAKR